LPLHEPYDYHHGDREIPPPQPNDVQERRGGQQAESNPLCKFAHVPLDLFEVVDVDLGVVPIGEGQTCGIYLVVWHIEPNLGHIAHVQTVSTVALVKNVALDVAAFEVALHELRVVIGAGLIDAGPSWNFTGL